MALDDYDKSTKDSVPDTIIAVLRERILRGEIAPGDRLPPERELAKNFGTNRTSLREALRALEAQGLVRARQGDGVRVLDFRASGDISLLPHYFAGAEPVEKLMILSHMMRLRDLLLPEAIRLCVELSADDHFAGMRELLRKLAEAEAVQDVPTMARLEVSLYRSIVAGSGALTYIWVFNSLERIVHGFIDAQPGMWMFVPGLIEAWDKIITALEARDVDAAREHFRFVLETYEAQASQLLAMFQEASKT